MSDFTEKQLRTVAAIIAGKDEVPEEPLSPELHAKLVDAARGLMSHEALLAIGFAHRAGYPDLSGHPDKPDHGVQLGHTQDGRRWMWLQKLQVWAELTQEEHHIIWSGVAEASGATVFERPVGPPWPDELEPGDWVTKDYEHFCRHLLHKADGHDEFEVPGGASMTNEQLWQAIHARMESDQFWPNVWLESDHGNLTLLTPPAKPAE